MLINERPFDKVISTVVWKVSETCNLNCPYCFMFNSLDKSFVSKPKIISKSTIYDTINRIKEYIESEKPELFDITIHGGEPLLIGVDKLRLIFSSLDKIRGVSLNIQTNGTLLNKDHINLFDEFGINVGVSLDGYPIIQNKTKTISGQDSYPYIIQGMKKLSTLHNHELFKGVLCVIDLNACPEMLYDHFLSLGIKNIDFLLPLRNHHTPLYYSHLKTEYYEWLKPIFLRYIDDDDDSISIRLFDSIIDLLIGSSEPMCSIRHSAMDIINIDTDGSIQLVDDLRICGDGFVDLELNVESNALVDFFNTNKVKKLYSYEINLPSKCKKCEYLNICGSGGHAFRYKGDNSFDEVSIYCQDTIKLISLIKEHIYE